MPNYVRNAIRNTFVHFRKQLSVSYQKVASDAVCERIQSLAIYQDAKHIAFYYAVNSEISLNPLWRLALSDGKQCYFPALNQNHTLAFLPVIATTRFDYNRYKIPEPVVEPLDAISIEQLDIIFVPVVAFDIKGMRIGMGGGYYDRTLENHAEKKVAKPYLIGVAYDFQRQPSLVREKWDVCLDAVITTETIYWSSS